MAAAALLLLLFLLLPLAALLRRSEGRAPRWGALHLLHPQGALHLRRLARRHGPLLRLRLGGRDVLVPSSVGTIREALVRHWGDWLGRPTSYLGSLVSQRGRDLALGGPCPGWRRQRGAVRGALARAGGRLGPLLWLQGRELCEVPPPGELRAFSRCLGELLQVWGHSSVRALDLLPPLRALPNPGLRKLLRLVQHRDTFVEAQIRRHQECPSPPPDTVLAALLGCDPRARGGPLSPPRLHMALVDLFIGGTETTAAALGWAVAFLLHRPEVKHMSLHVFRAALEGPVCHQGSHVPSHVLYVFSMSPMLPSPWASMLCPQMTCVAPCVPLCPLYGPKAPCVSLGVPCSPCPPPHG
ncbi:steroid 21-hydroxylase-like isoform X3 [Corvus cornix cornix]|uniref:steroid 21-hydroxylase-like isoform X3 n=1 Tax=Corvus cornix cornix TaxID=932674 RepID=UPI001950FA91|nr:steroid 21-hydroxylase-like isoform X3 [Corvus cornix cornix]